MTVTADTKSTQGKPQDAIPSMASYWHPIATAAEVVEQPRRFMLLGEPIVAFRDEQGVAAFKDLCIHRGTALSGTSPTAISPARTTGGNTTGPAPASTSRPSRKGRRFHARHARSSAGRRNDTGSCGWP
jgi:hypothetical protein